MGDTDQMGLMMTEEVRAEILRQGQELVARARAIERAAAASPSRRLDATLHAVQRYDEAARQLTMYMDSRTTFALKTSKNGPKDLISR